MSYFRDVFVFLKFGSEASCTAPRGVAKRGSRLGERCPRSSLIEGYIQIGFDGEGKRKLRRNTHRCTMITSSTYLPVTSFK